MLRHTLWALTLAGVLQVAGAADTTADTSTVPSAATAPATTAPATTEPAKPSFAQMQQDMDSKNYPAALQQAARLLAEPTVHNRYDVLLLKAQCHLYMKAAVLAGDAFTAAASATKTALPAAVATASHELVVNSTPLGYTPKFTRTTPPPAKTTTTAPASNAGGKNAKGSGKKGSATAGGPDPFAIKFSPVDSTVKPIDIVDPASRKTALVALYADELQAALPSLKAANSAKPLPAMLEALAKLAPLRPLELAATGADTENVAMVTALMTHAHQEMSQALDSATKQEKQISTRANETSTARTSGNYWVRTRRGLSGNDRTALQEMVTFCGEIVAACKAFEAVPGVDATMVNSLVTEAQALSKRATSTLDARY